MLKAVPDIHRVLIIIHLLAADLPVLHQEVPILQGLHRGLHRGPHRGLHQGLHRDPHRGPHQDLHLVLQQAGDSL